MADHRRGPASIRRLVTKPQRLRQEQGQHLRQLVLAFDLPEQPVAEIVAAIDRQTAALYRWTFVMLSPDQNAAVVSWLIEHSSRPMKAVKLWAHLFRVMRHDTGEIVASRAQLADELGISPNHAGDILRELANIGALVRVREGRGSRWFMNPTVATQLSGRARDDAQSAAPQLRLVP